MAEGYPFIVKLNLPPEAQYASGHSLIVQGETPEAVAEQLTSINELPDTVGKSVILRFLEHGLLGVARDALAKEKAVQSATIAAEKKAAKAAGSEEKAPATAKKPSDSAPKSAKGESEASPALKKAVAKKTGKALEELEGLTTKQAQALMKEVSK